MCIRDSSDISVLSQVTGIVRDSKGTERYLLTGTWDERLEGVKVLDITPSSQQHNVVYNTSSPMVLWQRQYPPYVINLLPVLASNRAYTLGDRRRDCRSDRRGDYRL